MDWKKYLKQSSWLKSIIIMILSIIICFFISFYFYKKSIAKPEPILITDPSRALIVNADYFSDTTLKVVQADGNEVAGNVSAVRFYFWNNGNKSIKASNILEPINISLNDPNAVILDYKILKTSRKVVAPKFVKNTSYPKNSIAVSFEILEENDGITGQLIYSGNPEAELVVLGTIEGSKGILSDSELMISRFWWKEFFLQYLIMLAPALAATIAISVEILVKHIRKRKKDKFDLFILALMVTIILVFSPIFAFLQAKGTLTYNVIKNVPRNIMP